MWTNERRGSEVCGPMRELLSDLDFPDDVATGVHETVGRGEDVPGVDDGAATPPLLSPLVGRLQEDQPGILVGFRLPPSHHPLHPSRLDHHHHHHQQHQLHPGGDRERERERRKRYFLLSQCQRAI